MVRFNPHEGFLDGAAESFQNSGLEARDEHIRIMLFVFIAIDEVAANGPALNEYNENVEALIDAQAEATSKGVWLNVGLAWYNTMDSLSFGQSQVPLTPPGGVFPYDAVRTLASNVMRKEDDPGYGNILETSLDWMRWIRNGISSFGLRPNSRIVLRLDGSGSMSRYHYGSVPEETLVRAQEVYPGVETKQLIFGDERWAKWPVEEWEAYKADHPELP